MQVRSVMVLKRNNEIVNRLNKTKVEKNVNLALERKMRDEEERSETKQTQKEKLKKEQEERETKKKQEDLLHYTSIMKKDQMRSNQHDGDVNPRDIEEDFM